VRLSTAGLAIGTGSNKKAASFRLHGARAHPVVPWPPLAKKMKPVPRLLRYIFADDWPSSPLPKKGALFDTPCQPSVPGDMENCIGGDMENCTTS
jgi:hypothetical protein